MSLRAGAAHRRVTKGTLITMETNEPFSIETARLTLRDYQEEDYQAVHAFRSDPLVARYWTGKPDTPDDTRAFLLRVRENACQRPRTQYRLAVVLRETGAVIGGARQKEFRTS